MNKLHYRVLANPQQKDTRQIACTVTFQSGVKSNFLITVRENLFSEIHKTEIENYLLRLAPSKII